MVSAERKAAGNSPAHDREAEEEEIRSHHDGPRGHDGRDGVSYAPSLTEHDASTSHSSTR